MGTMIVLYSMIVDIYAKALIIGLRNMFLTFISIYTIFIYHN